MFERIREDFAFYRSWRHRAFWALLLFRYGQWSLSLRVGPLRWATGKVYGLIRIFSPIFTGVAIDRGMRVGRNFRIIHAGGIVLHPQVTFGDRCGIMHNVTVGTNMDKPGVPRIGDDVFIGAGAVVIGNIVVGDGALIAANSLVFFDVPADALAMGVPAVIYPNKSRLRRRPGEPTTPDRRSGGAADSDIQPPPAKAA
jgi:serine O-acetyltransferase